MADHGSKSPSSKRQKEPPKRWTHALDDDLGLSPRLENEPPPAPPNPEEPWSKSNQKTPSRSLFLMGLLATFLITGAVFLHFKLSPSPHEEKLTPVPRPDPLSQSFMDLATAAEIEASTSSTIRGFMEATNFADRCQFVIGGSEIESRMREFYQRPENPLPDGFGKILATQTSAFAGIPLQIVSASESNGLAGWTFNLLPSHDRMLIDWESSVAYGEMSWPDFLNKRPTEPVAMRIYLKRCHRYIPPYTDESAYEAFEITSRGSHERIVGYVERDSDLQQQLNTAVPGTASQPVHVKLRWETEDPETFGVEISSLLHNFWVTPNRIPITKANSPES